MKVTCVWDSPDSEGKVEKVYDQIKACIISGVVMNGWRADVSATLITEDKDPEVVSCNKIEVQK